MLEGQQRAGVFPTQWILAVSPVLFAQLDHLIQVFIEAIEQGWAFGHDSNGGAESVTAHTLDALCRAAVGNHPEPDELTGVPAPDRRHSPHGVEHSVGSVTTAEEVGQNDEITNL